MRHSPANLGPAYDPIANRLNPPGAPSGGGEPLTPPAEAPIEHPRRLAILDLVRVEPGVHLQAAKEALGLGEGTLMHHVRVLTERGYLWVVESGVYQRLYPTNISFASVVRDAVLRHPRAKALYDLVQAWPGIGLRPAARELQVPVSSLQWHADKLQEVGLVVRGPTGMFAAV